MSGPEPPSHICTPRTVYFYDKTKISQENFRGNYYLLLNIARGNVLAFLTWAKSLTKFNAKMQDFKYVLDLNCK